MNAPMSHEERESYISTIERLEREISNLQLQLITKQENAETLRMQFYHARVVINQLSSFLDEGR